MILWAQIWEAVQWKSVAELEFSIRKDEKEIQIYSPFSYKELGREDGKDPCLKPWKITDRQVYKTALDKLSDLEKGSLTSLDMNGCVLWGAKLFPNTAVSSYID